VYRYSEALRNGREWSREIVEWGSGGEEEMERDERREEVEGEG